MFLFLGGDPSLDLVNTVVVAGGEPVDLVPTPAALAEWVSAASLGSPAGITQAVHAEVVTLRGALKNLFDAVTSGDPAPDDALATLNAALSPAPGTELRRSADGLERVLRRDAGLPWVLADAGASLLTSDRAGRVRRCANHDTCVLLFLDTSRSRTRRWCSMETCGNRSKVAAHSTRQRRS